MLRHCLIDLQSSFPVGSGMTLRGWYQDSQREEGGKKKCLEKSASVQYVIFDMVGLARLDHNSLFPEENSSHPINICPPHPSTYAAFASSDASSPRPTIYPPLGSCSAAKVASAYVPILVFRGDSCHGGKARGCHRQKEKKTVQFQTPVGMAVCQTHQLNRIPRAGPRRIFCPAALGGYELVNIHRSNLYDACKKSLA